MSDRVIRIDSDVAYLTGISGSDYENTGSTDDGTAGTDDYGYTDTQDTGDYGGYSDGSDGSGTDYGDTAGY